MNTEQQEPSLEKEFELERVILFSDAVFAIAITLLIIDIKWPDLPENLKEVRLMHNFRPTIFGLLAFTTSFLYIGRSWAIHLRLFRLLRKYDQGLINRNLLFLFFIVVFPFTNAGLTRYNSEIFVLPVIVYMTNLALLGIAHYLLCRYIIVQKPSLAVEGEKEEKTFIHMRGRYTMIVTSAIPVVAIALWLLFPDNPVYVLYSFALLPIGLRFIKRRLRHLRARAAAAKS